MGFELVCMTMIALLFAVAVTFFGYRLFLFLLPIWGFFFGLGLGAQALQALFGEGFLATVTSWMVGLIVGIIFAVLSYLFYIVAVAILSFSAGYALTVALLGYLNMQLELIVWILAVVVGVIVAAAVIYFNVQKYAIIIITAIGGTAAMIYSVLVMFSDSWKELLGNPVQRAIENNILWLLFFIVVAGAGIVVQLKANRSYDIEEYDRWAEA